MALSELELNITKKEDALHALELELCEPEIYSDHALALKKQQDIQALKSEIEALYITLDEMLS